MQKQSGTSGLRCSNARDGAVDFPGSRGLCFHSEQMGCCLSLANWSASVDCGIVPKYESISSVAAAHKGMVYHLQVLRASAAIEASSGFSVCADLPLRTSNSLKESSWSPELIPIILQVSYTDGDVMEVLLEQPSLTK